MKISGANLAKNINIPTSKSYANRALICAALQREETTINNLPEAQDVLDMLHALEVLGLEIEKNKDQVRVLNSVFDLTKAPTSTIFLGEGGTTIRFILPLLALLPFDVSVKLHSRFKGRPLEHLIDTLILLGAKVVQEEECITITGRLNRTQEVEVDCQETTQFASALMLIAREIELKVKLKNVNTSKSYLEMSQNVINHFQKHNQYEVPADLSSLTYIAAYAAMTEKKSIINITKRDPNQADDKFLDYLKELGATVEINSDGLTIFPIKVARPCVFDVSDCLDAVPALVFVLAYSQKTQKIINLKNLKHKESDRLTEILKVLDIFEIPHTYDEVEDALYIDGQSPDGLKRTVEVAFDHRMVMMASLFLKINGGGEIAPAQAVKKSFPNFFTDF